MRVLPFRLVIKMDELKKDGWSLNKDALLELGDDKTNFESTQDVLKLVLDLDITDFGAPLLDARLDRQAGKLEGPAVLQIIKIRNVLSPKVNEHSRQGGDRLLRLTLTDGINTVSAIEKDTISKISMNTPPGTKLCLIGTVAFEHGFLQLSERNTRILGGQVPKLVEKWEVNKDSQIKMHLRANKGQEGPPPWIPFGKRINKPHSIAQQSNQHFRSMDIVNALTKNESPIDSKESTEFEAARLATIAELKSQAMQGPKKFASVQPQVLNKPKPPMPQREHVPMDRKPPPQSDERGDRSDRDRGRGGGRRGRGRFDEDREDPDAPRPSGPSTLFDYLLPKVPLTNRPHHHYSPPPPPPPPPPSSRQQHDSRGDGRRDNGRENGRGGGSSGGRGGGGQWRDRNANSNSKYRQTQTHQPPPPPPAAASFRDDFPSIESSVDALRNKMRIGPGPVSTPQRFQERRSTTGSKSAQNSQSQGDMTSNDSSRTPQWKPGQKCLAPYTDGRFYMATVISLGPADMCTVRYDDYGNTSSVPQGVMVMPQFSAMNWGL